MGVYLRSDRLHALAGFGLSQAVCRTWDRIRTAQRALHVATGDGNACGGVHCVSPVADASLGEIHWRR